MKLNGNLVLNSAGQSEIQNLVIERVSGSLPAFSSAEKGRLVFFNGDSKFYLNDGAQWVSIATGGNAAALQTEVDSIESSLGALIGTDGTFNAAGASFTKVTAPTSITNILTQLDAAISGKDTLGELLDVSLTASADGDVLFYDSGLGKWTDRQILLADVSDVTATFSEVNQLASSGITTSDLVKLVATTSSAAELNILTGATLTTTELNYVDGVTSAIQTQLDNKQPLDAQLTSIAGITPAVDDVLVGIAGGVYQVFQGAGFRSTQGLVIGTDVQAWDADLDSMAAFAPAANSTEARPVTLNNPTPGDATISDFIVSTGVQTEGQRWALQRGASARSALGLGDIARYDASDFLRADGASTVTANIPMAGFKITGLGEPTAAADAATKNYVDAVAAGLAWKQAVDVATTAAITLSGEQTIDGVGVTAGMRVLVKDQATGGDNGIYVVASGAWTRAVDADAYTELQDGTSVFVREGAVNADSGFVQTATLASLATAQVWTNFSGASSFVDGIGLKRTGNQVDVNLGAGIAALPSDEVGIDLYDANTGALILTTTGTNRSTAADSKIHLLTNTAQLQQDANGLYIVNAGITPALLASTVAGDGLTGGAGNALAVVSAAGTAAVGADDTANWNGVATLTVTANDVGVTLGATSTTAAPGNHTHKATAITFANGTSGLLATSVQGAIDEVEGRVDTLESNGSALQTEVNKIETAVGLNSAGDFITITGNYTGSATTTAEAIQAVDGKLKAAETALAARVANGYFLYNGSASTSHVVTHGIGSQYCTVTVIDAATDEQIIPNSVTFDSASQLTVTLNTSLAIKVVVMGLAAYTPV